MIGPVSRVIALAVALLAASGRVASAQPPQTFLEHGVRLTIAARSTTTTQRVSVMWGNATDGRLSADTFHVSMRLLNAATPWSKTLATRTLSAAVDIPIPLFTGDSVGLYVVVRPSRRGVISTDSVYGVRWFRRMLSKADIAHQDSFPKANHRITLCSLYGQRLSPSEITTALAQNLAKLTTAADSGRERNEWEAIRLGVDSIYTPQTGEGIRIFKGYRYPIAMLIKNRYTGRVRAEGGVQWSTPTPEVIGIDQGEADCSAKIAAWETERSG